MNLIEGRVEWHGNGVVVIRERSMMRAVWRFCIHSERQLHSAIQCMLDLSKNLLSRRALNTEDFDTPASKEQFCSTKPSEQTASLSQQTQPLAREPVAGKMKTHQSWSKVRPMGTLTEIRRYAGSEHATSVANGDEQGALQQLLPALAGFCHDRWLVLVSPPQRPNVAELTAAGIDPSRVLLVHARDSKGVKFSGLNNGINGGLNNGLNIVERALQSGTCGAVVAWLEECDAPTLQRLRRAAVVGHAWGVMFREDGVDKSLAPKTGQKFSPVSLSTVTPVNVGMRETVVFAEKTNKANASKVVNIHSDLATKQVYQQKDVTQLEIAMS